MKRVFVAETTNNEDWEVNHGFHLVEAESKEAAGEVVKRAVLGSSVVNIWDLKEFMRSDFQKFQEGKLKTIIESQTM